MPFFSLDRKEEFLGRVEARVTSGEYLRSFYRSRGKTFSLAILYN
jgi:hypothetical protein